jgi:hypothetical protein
MIGMLRVSWVLLDMESYTTIWGYFAVRQRVRSCVGSTILSRGNMFIFLPPGPVINQPYLHSMIAI